MKLKQFLYLLAVVPFIFSSCKKDDDYRDKFEGTYDTEKVGFEAFVVNDEVYSTPVKDNEVIIVNKLGANQLMLTIGKEFIIVTVNEQGNLTIPTESYSLPTQIDPDTGDRITINFTITRTGNITSKTLYIKETLSGDALIEGNGQKILADITGTTAYNGTKK